MNRELTCRVAASFNELPNGAQGFTSIAISDISLPLSGGPYAMIMANSEKIFTEAPKVSMREKPCENLLEKLKATPIEKRKALEKPPKRLADILDELIIPSGVVVGKKVNMYNPTSASKDSYAHIMFEPVTEFKLTGDEKFRLYLSFDSRGKRYQIKADDRSLNGSTGLTVNLGADRGEVKNISLCFVNPLTDQRQVGIKQVFEPGKVGKSLKILMSGLGPSPGRQSPRYEFTLASESQTINEGKDDTAACGTNVDNYRSAKIDKGQKKKRVKPGSPEALGADFEEQLRQMREALRK